MREDRLLRELVESARRDSPPPVDVRATVLKAVLQKQPARASDSVLYVFAAASVLVASIALIVGIQSWLVISDPAVEIVQSSEMVIE